MYRDHAIGVVVPAYDEEALIGAVLDSLPEFVDRAYVVDDGSSDGTWDEITRRVEDVDEGEREGDPGIGRPAGDGGLALESRIVPLRHDRNRGVGAAIKTGYRAALEDDAGIDIVAVMAGDAQMDPDVLERLLDPIVDDRAEYAKATRLLSKEYREGMSTWRFFGNSLLSVLTKIASGYWKTTDPQNGYTAISLEALEAVDIDGLYEYYGYCNHLLVMLNVREMRVVDVAIPAIYGTERSGIMYPQYVRKVSLMLLSSFLWRLKVRYLVRDFHPLALFYVVGATSSGIGLLSGTWALYDRIVRKRPLHSRLVSSLVLFALGWLFMLFAMVFDAEHNAELVLQKGPD